MKTHVHKKHKKSMFSRLQMTSSSLLSNLISSSFSSTYFHFHRHVRLHVDSWGDPCRARRVDDDGPSSSKLRYNLLKHQLSRKDWAKTQEQPRTKNTKQTNKQTNQPTNQPTKQTNKQTSNKPTPTKQTPNTENNFPRSRILYGETLQGETPLKNPQMISLP